MSVAELAQYVGKVGTIRLSGLLVNVTVLDVKQAYGRIRYRVTPVSGGGDVWLEGVVFHA